MYARIIKPILDKAIAAILLFLISPFILIISIFLLLYTKESPLFIQTRVGKSNHFFNIYKFKTLNNKCDIFGVHFPEHKRINKIGRYMRRLSVDELPQLINILKGEMSLVGPRPLLPEYLPLYNSRQRRRHEVKPGITGWAQVNGRNKIRWEEKFELDLWYIENLSFKTDLKILSLTIIQLIKSFKVEEDIKPEISKFEGTAVN